MPYRFFSSIVIIAMLASKFSYAKIFSANRALKFRENKGQVKDQRHLLRNDVLFYGNTRGMGYYLKKDGISYQLYQPQVLLKNEASESLTTTYRIDITWSGANKKAKIVKGKALTGVEHFYNVPKPVLNVKSYETLLLEDLYEGINLKYYSTENGLKYDYIVSPGADYKTIQLKIDGATKIELSKDGSVVIKTPLGNITEAAPVAYQNGKKIAAAWAVKGNVLSFKLGTYDKTRELVIDPLVRDWGTYFGGIGDELGNGIAINSSGNIAICGVTNSTSAIATTGAHQTTVAGNKDAFFAIFSASGSLVLSTYYGGSDVDEAKDCAFDGSGNLFVTGNTRSTSGIATSGAHQTTVSANKKYGFLAKFSSSGVLLWGTYYGGTIVNSGIHIDGKTSANSCAADATGNVYICGETGATNNIATPGALQTTKNGLNDNGFIAKFSNGGSLIWGTYFGSSGKTRLYSCTVDGNGNVYACGEAEAGYTGLATSGAFQTTTLCHAGIPYPPCDGNGILIKLNANGVRQWSTYLGRGSVAAYDCIADNYQNVYVTGYATMYDTGIITTPNSYSPNNSGDDDAFLAKFDSAGSHIWGTYFGGDYDERSTGVTIESGKVWITGYAESPTKIATPGAHNTVSGLASWSIGKPFLAEFDTTGQQRTYGTYFSSSLPTHYGEGVKCAADPNGNVFVLGNTGDTTGIATPGSHQPLHGGAIVNSNYEPFLVKMSSCIPPLATLTTATSHNLCPGSSVTLGVNAVAGCSYKWYKNDSVIAGATNSTYTATKGGNYGVAVINATGCAGFAYISVAAVGKPTTTVSKTYVNCYGGSTGAITITASGTGAPFTYTWANSTNTTNILSNIPAGTYYATTTNTFGCSKSDTVIILQNTPMVITKTQTNVSCFGGSNGSAAVTLSGGNTVSYQTLWSNNGTGLSISGLTAGMYTIKVTNPNATNCVKYDTFYITQPPALYTTLNVTDNNCYGDSTGAAWVNATGGGVQPYTYLWTNANSTTIATGAVASNLKAGVYYHTLTDANQCLKKDTVTIAQPPQTLVDICAVTVDSITGKNLVIFEKQNVQRAILFKVYRETSVGGQYVLVDTLLPSQFSTLLDTVSVPLQQSYLYKISAVDSCSNESPLSTFHRTIHLVSNVGVNGEINLTWNGYQGRSYSTHYIMRSVNNGPFTEIAQISSSLTSYSDLNPPSGQKNYRIEIDLSTSCTPSKTTAYNRVSSNAVTHGVNAVNGLAKPSVQIVPNPTTGVVNIIGVLPSKIQVTDITGKLVITERNRSTLSLEGLSSGTYFIRLYDKENRLYHYEKLIKK